MGKGVIVGGGMAGLYTIEMDYGTERRDEMVANLEDQGVKIDQTIVAQQAEVDSLQAKLDAQIAALNDEIENYLAAFEASPGEPPDMERLNEATVAAIETRSYLSEAENRLDISNLNRTTVTSRIAELQALPLTDSRSAWCADYTEDASGTVATIEVPGEPAQIIIAPDGRTATDADGFLLKRDVMSPEQAFFNAAILPGWQKFQPTFRVGSLVSKNTDLNTATVTLDPAVSSAQGLPIDQAVTLTNVPVQYMTCNAAPFLVGDRVIVALGGSWSTPTVVGFESNPRPCQMIVAIPTIIYVAAENGTIGSFLPDDPCENPIVVNDPATSHALSVEYKLDRGRPLIRTSNVNEILDATTAGQLAGYSHSPIGTSELRLKKYDIDERIIVDVWRWSAIHSQCQASPFSSVTTTPANLNTAAQTEMEFGDLAAEFISAEEVRFTATLKRSGVGGFGRYPPTGDWNGTSLRASISKTSVEIASEVIGITLADLRPISGMVPIEFIKVLNSPYPTGINSGGTYTWQRSSYIVVRYGLPPAP